MQVVSGPTWLAPEFVDGSLIEPDGPELLDGSVVVGVEKVDPPGIQAFARVPAGCVHDDCAVFGAAEDVVYLSPVPRLTSQTIARRR
jgi:hypothetical protein